MRISLPLDLKAETIVNYLQKPNLKIELKGTHKRNAYEDILAINEEDDDVVVNLSKKGLYDILPEALFHPIDRFENLPPNEYKERFAEECELQQAEESNARRFFAIFDRFIFDIECEYERIKNEFYSDDAVLRDIICDNILEEYSSNRFVKRLAAYTSQCNRLRGNIDLITIILRKIMLDEGISLSKDSNDRLYKDSITSYNSTLDYPMDSSSDDYYLGNEYYEQVTEYVINYWSENECNENFLSFLEEIKIFENFINDYFMGIETSVRFKVETTTLPVRLSDSIYFNYLDYNTNL